MTEEEFLKNYNMEKYPRPSLTADIAVFEENDGGLSLLLIRRAGHPFIGKYALPGGFASKGEAIEETAARELFEETSISGLPLALTGVFSNPGRDPRGWVVSCSFTSIVSRSEYVPKAGDDASEASWFVLHSESGADGSKVLNLNNGSESLSIRYKLSERHNILDALPCIEVLESEDLAFDHAEIILRAAAYLACKPEIKSKITLLSKII